MYCMNTTEFYVKGFDKNSKIIIFISQIIFPLAVAEKRKEVKFEQNNKRFCEFWIGITCFLDKNNKNNYLSFGIEMRELIFLLLKLNYCFQYSKVSIWHYTFSIAFLSELKSVPEILKIASVIKKDATTTKNFLIHHLILKLKKQTIF